MSTTITRGEAARWRTPLRDENGAPLNLTGCTVQTICTTGAGEVIFTNHIDIDVSGSVVTSHNMALESTVVAGVVIETIPSEETLLIPVGVYLVQLNIELADGSDYTPIDAQPLVVRDFPVPDVSALFNGINRRSIRRTVARMLSDFYEARDSVGQQTGQITDTRGLARETGFFNGMQVLFSNPASPHYGTISTITRSDGPTRTIFFEPPLAVPSIAGETVELYNFKGRGTTVDQYNASINDAILIARELHDLTPVSVVGDTAWSSQTRSLAVPENLVSFTGVSFTGRDLRVNHIPAGAVRVDRMTRTVELRGSQVTRWNGYTPTFYGYVSPELLESDEDYTAVNSEWLFNEVKAQILERMVASGMPVGTQDRLYLQERTEASGKRPIIVARAMPNTIRLR
jgi:hypothetical protein